MKPQMSVHPTLVQGQGWGTEKIEAPRDNHLGSQEVLIQPSRGWVSLKLRDVWEYRELLYFLAWRDIKV